MIDIQALKRTAREHERMDDDTLDLECNLLTAEIMARKEHGNKSNTGTKRKSDAGRNTR